MDVPRGGCASASPLFRMRRLLIFYVLFALGLHASGADVPGSRDPAGLQRWTGSSIVGYQSPRQDEYYYSTGSSRSFGNVNPFGPDSRKLQGFVSRWTYLVTDSSRSVSEIFSHYRTELGKLGLETVYFPDPDMDGWFGPGYSSWEQRAKLGQILDYNEAEERYLVARSTGGDSVYYVLFVTSFKDGVVPEALKNILKVKMPLVQLDIIAPSADQLQASAPELRAAPAGRPEAMNPDEMLRGLGSAGSLTLYGLVFGTDKDTLLPESAPSVERIAELLQKDPALKLYIVCHTERTGTLEASRDLSERRAKSVVQELITGHKVAANRLTPVGAAFLAPVATSANEEGRAKNRRVVLIPQETLFSP
ncbi:MAG: yiaD 2 [Verrucomicrobiales bacterium]|nr:yiaD 2 [Verrucomicrobiales bacterium]